MLIYEIVNGQLVLRYEPSDSARVCIYKCGAGCELVHIGLLEVEDEKWRIDISPEMIDILIPSLLKIRAQFATTSGHTAPERQQ